MGVGGRCQQSLSALMESVDAHPADRHACAGGSVQPALFTGGTIHGVALDVSDEAYLDLSWKQRGRLRPTDPRRTLGARQVGTFG